MEFEGGTHKSTERPRSLETPSRTMESMCPRMSCAQKGQRGPQCCTHCTKQLKWRRFRQHGRIRESPSFCSKVHIIQQLMASNTSEHNSSPQKRHNWSGSRQLGCTATPQHRDRDNTPEPHWHTWLTRSSSAERSTGTTSGGRPAAATKRNFTCTRLRLPVQSPQRRMGICHGTTTSHNFRKEDTCTQNLEP